MTPREWLRPIEQEAWSGLMGATELLDVALDRQLARDSGLTHARYAILAALSVAPRRTLRMADVAALTHSSQSRTSHAVNPLEQAGWLTRSRNPDDNREVLATLTDVGYSVLRAAAPGHVAEVRRLVFDRLSDTQTKQLRSIAHVILTALADDGFPTPAVVAANRRAGK